MDRELFEDRQIRLALERGDEVEARFWTRVKTDVDRAPPLSASQRDQLAVLLRPAPAPQQSPRRARPLREAA